MALRSGVGELVGCICNDPSVSDGGAMACVVRFVFELQVAGVAVPGKFSAASDGLLVTVGAIVSAKARGVEAVDVARVAAEGLVGLVLSTASLGLRALLEAVPGLSPSVGGGGVGAHVETVLLLVEAVLFLDGCIDSCKLLRRKVLFALDTFMQRVVRAEATPGEEVSRPRAASSKTVGLSGTVHGPEAAGKHGFEGDKGCADLGDILSLRDGTGSQESSVGEAEAPTTGTLDVARTVLADKVLSEAGSSSTVEAGSRTNVE